MNTYLMLLAIGSSIIAGIGLVSFVVAIIYGIVENRRDKRRLTETLEKIRQITDKG